MDASAQATGQSAISQMYWNLVDLDPNDGITPAVTFTNFVLQHETMIRTANGVDRQEQHTILGNSPFTSRLGLQGVTGTSSYGNATLGSTGNLTQSGYAWVEQKLSGDFTLTPNTIMEYGGILSGQTSIGNVPFSCGTNCIAFALTTIDSSTWVNGQVSQGYTHEYISAGNANQTTGFLRACGFCHGRPPTQAEGVIARHSLASIKNAIERPSMSKENHPEPGKSEPAQAAIPASPRLPPRLQVTTPASAK